MRLRNCSVKPNLTNLTTQQKHKPWSGLSGVKTPSDFLSYRCLMKCDLARQLDSLVRTAASHVTRKSISSCFSTSSGVNQSASGEELQAWFRRNSICMLLLARRPCLGKVTEPDLLCPDQSAILTLTTRGQCLAPTNRAAS